MNLKERLMLVKRPSDRAFGITLAILFALTFIVFYYIFDVNLIWAPWVSIIFVLIALLAPGVLLPLNRLWLKLASQLSKINNIVLLGVFFLLAIIPTGLTLRIFGYDPMGKKRKKTNNSYWTQIDRHTDTETLKDLF